MYEWLSDSLDNSGTVVTANRRLARVLGDHYATEQLNAGIKAWRSPAIYNWQDWLVASLGSAQDQADLPTRINAQQSQLLWERCLRKDLNESEAGISRLVRLSRETWQRLADWQVPISEVARSAQSDDQRLFASVAGRYLGILERENWVDDAGIAALVLDLITQAKITASGQHSFVGFDRQRPIILAIQDALQASGVDVSNILESARHSKRSLQSFENATAELRSAGAWARRCMDDSPDARIAIIVNGLERDAEGHFPSRPRGRDAGLATRS